MLPDFVDDDGSATDADSITLLLAESLAIAAVVDTGRARFMMIVGVVINALLNVTQLMLITTKNRMWMDSLSSSDAAIIILPTTQTDALEETDKIIKRLTCYYWLTPINEHNRLGGGVYGDGAL